jgi:branched-subunit amino acid aminotransferase/4-amino-4-deoxychorismate lyase
MLARERAVVSAFDRGVLYGDGLFETMRVEGGRVHLLERHLARLATSAASIEIVPPPAATLREALARTIEANDAGRCIARLTVTRGSEEGEPTLIVALRPLLHTGNLQQLASLTILRTPHPGPMERPTIKSLSRLDFVLAARELARSGADEGAMMRDGYVIEGTVANLFVVDVSGRVLTAPLSSGALPGIARGRVIELARSEGIVVLEERFDVEQLRRCRECFSTNAARGVVPIGSIDGATVPGADIGMRLRERYDKEMPDEFL